MTNIYDTLLLGIGLSLVLVIGGYLVSVTYAIILGFIPLSLLAIAMFVFAPVDV